MTENNNSKKILNVGSYCRKYGRKNSGEDSQVDTLEYEAFANRLWGSRCIVEALLEMEKDKIPEMVAIRLMKAPSDPWNGVICIKREDNALYLVFQKNGESISKTHKVLLNKKPTCPRTFFTECYKVSEKYWSRNPRKHKAPLRSDTCMTPLFPEADTGWGYQNKRLETFRDLVKVFRSISLEKLPLDMRVLISSKGDDPDWESGFVAMVKPSMSVNGEKLMLCENGVKKAEIIMKYENDEITHKNVGTRNDGILWEFSDTIRCLIQTWLAEVKDIRSPWKCRGFTSLPSKKQTETSPSPCTTEDCEYFASKEGLCSVCWRRNNGIEVPLSEKEKAKQLEASKKPRESVGEFFFISTYGNRVDKLSLYCNFIAQTFAKMPGNCGSHILQLEKGTRLELDIEGLVPNYKREVSEIQYTKEVGDNFGYFVVRGRHGDRISKDDVGWFEKGDQVEMYGFRDNKLVKF